MTDYQTERLEDDTPEPEATTQKAPRKRPRFSIPSLDKYADQSLNATIITLWIEDMLEKDFGVKFNADLSYAKTPKGVLTGDASLFLSARHAPQEVQDKHDLLAWLENLDLRLINRKVRYGSSEYLINRFTGIPIDIARQLLNPTVLMNCEEYALNKMTAREFVTTLRNYLITGVVSWDWLLPYEDK